MTSCAATLGVAHPPGYPLYVLAGRAAVLLLPGNAAYALNVFSALCGAGALAVMFLLLCRLFYFLPAFFFCLLFGLNTTFWHVSSVSEMYSLNLLFALILLYLGLGLLDGYGRRRFYLLSFLYGLFLGNRMDIVLWGPAMLLSVLVSMRRSEAGCVTRMAAADFLKGAGFFLLGFSIYMYLPLRSLQNPILDWNHPADFSGFLGSITRKSYGGTLDLLSKKYSTGGAFPS
ncbi:MAG: DUF2723 domain-containing protein [bacterium]